MFFSIAGLQHRINSNCDGTRKISAAELLGVKHVSSTKVPKFRSLASSPIRYFGKLSCHFVLFCLQNRIP